MHYRRNRKMSRFRQSGKNRSPEPDERTGFRALAEWQKRNIPGFYETVKSDSHIIWLEKEGHNIWGMIQFM